MGLVVVTPGLFTTVQDLGRPGFRAFGVSPGGVFDRGSAGLANALLGNLSTCALLEMTIVGGTLEALCPLGLALAGATMSARVQTRGGRDFSVNIPSAFPLRQGDRLTLGPASLGARTYLATLGGWRTPVILGSRSDEAPTHAGEVIPSAPGWTPSRRPDPSLDPFRPIGLTPLRILPGPDEGPWHDGSALGVDQGYRVGSLCNRMGLRLEGPSWVLAMDPERVSTPVAPGALQAAGGQPLLLGVACGTMGGYPHVAHVISADLDRVAQARPGDRLSFEFVSAEEARRLDRVARAELTSTLLRVAAVARDRTGFGRHGGMG